MKYSHQYWLDEDMIYALNFPNLLAPRADKLIRGKNL